MSSDWRRMCYVLWVKTHKLPTWWTKLVNSSGKQHELSTPRWCSLKPQQICEPAGVNKTISLHFFSGLELEGITKDFNDWSRWKQWVSFPSTSLFPLGPFVKCLLYSTDIYSSYSLILVIVIIFFQNMGYFYQYRVYVGLYTLDLSQLKYCTRPHSLLSEKVWTATLSILLLLNNRKHQN